MTDSIHVSASSLILLAPFSSKNVSPSTMDYRVLLLKRNPHARFMPGAYVFPGGQVDELDRQDSSLLTETFPWKKWGWTSRIEAQASLISALRETHEEAGEDLNTWNLDTSRLSCYAHWLTPPITKKRFDTFFWLLTLPSSFVPKVDGQEIVDGGWWSPEQALEAYAQEKIDLAPPTLRILHELIDLISISPPFNITPYKHSICPVIYKHNQTLSLCFFGDRMYTEIDQGGSIVKEDHDHHQGPLNRVTKNKQTGRWDVHFTQSI